MSHGSFGKQCCLAWLIATDTWVSRTRGWAHNRQVWAASSLTAMYTWMNPMIHLTPNQPLHPTDVTVFTHVHASFLLSLHIYIFVYLHCVSGSVHSLPAGRSCSSTHSLGHILLRAANANSNNQCYESLSQHATCLLVFGTKQFPRPTTSPFPSLEVTVHFAYNISMWNMVETC